MGPLLIFPLFGLVSFWKFFSFGLCDISETAQRVQSSTQANKITPFTALMLHVCTKPATHIHFLMVMAFTPFNRFDSLVLKDYVTNALWQSGDMSEKCNKKVVNFGN